MARPETRRALAVRSGHGRNGPGACGDLGRYRVVMGLLLQLPPGAWFAVFGAIVLAGGIALYCATGEPKYEGVHTPRYVPPRGRHRIEDAHTAVVNVQAYRVKRTARVH